MKSSFTGWLLFIFVFISEFSVAECSGQSKKDSSIVLTDNSVTYEVPMAYELMHIAMALTDTTIVSNGYNIYNEVIDTKSDYYKEVMKYFEPYKEHPLIKELNRCLRKSAGSYRANLQLAYNAVYIGGTVRKENILPFFHRMASRAFSTNRRHLKDFAEVSNFGKFYYQHREYYDAVLREVQKNADVSQQKTWLEKEFPRKYDGYSIVVSPLMGATHFTRRYSAKGKRNAIMWVSKFENNENQSPALNKAFYTGIVMTEIDHGYVNPLSDGYNKALKGIMGEDHRVKWADGGATNSYTTGYKIFNEYMTHGVYLLFIIENLSIGEQQIIEKAKINSMETRRKFVNFGNFYRALKDIYLSRKPNESIRDLYPLIIEWCKRENEK